MADVIGSPVELAVKKLPNGVQKKIHKVTEAALYKATEAVLWSMKNDPSKSASTKLHKLFAATSGAIGGAFGFIALYIELPISTTIMMRSVADIARSEGFDLNDFGTKQSCIEVFALGGKSNKDDSSESGYYIMRGFTTETMKHLSKELAEIAARNVKGAAKIITPKQAGSWLAKLIEKVAARFGITITEKFAAQVVPVIGGVTGAALNIMFTNFYQDMARGHFIVKRLENKYGCEAVREAYLEIMKVKSNHRRT